MKKILLSLLTISLVSAAVFSATSAYFSNKETSVGNTFTAGTIDISVAGQNPWNKTYPMLLDKPSQTNYINFTIQNVGNNDANVWKRLNNVTTNGGASTFCSVASSEPEYVEGGGQVGQNGECQGTYVERNDLDSYMVYDLYVCPGQVGITPCEVEGTEAERASGKRTGGGWTAVIPEANQVRVDNVNGIWIKLNNALAPGEKLAVSQSYHLTAWDDAGEPEITNWAQGDQMKFDIELEARQLTAPAPGSEEVKGTLTLKQKDTTTWNEVPGGATGTLTYNVSGATFNYDFQVSGLDNVNYSLIYYADPWPGNHPGALIGTYTASSGSINVTGQSTELGMDLPGPTDANYPAGAKIWLVPSSAYNSSTQSVTSWGAGKYLFEMNLITYDDL